MENKKRGKINPENPMIDLFSDQGKVALKVFEKEDGGTHLNELVNDLRQISSKMTISRAIDSLLDKGILHAEWKKRMINTAKGKRKAWVRSFTLRGEWRKIVEKYYSTL